MSGLGFLNYCMGKKGMFCYLTTEIEDKPNFNNNLNISSNLYSKL